MTQQLPKTWLESDYDTVQQNGVALPKRTIINFLAGAVAQDNATAGTTEITISGGVDAHTTLLDAFTQPNLSTVTAHVQDTAWMVVNQILFIAGGGYYRVNAVVDATHVRLVNLAYPGNAAIGASVAAPALISPGGLRGATGVSAYSTTQSDFVQPAVGDTVSVFVDENAWPAYGQVIFIAGGGYYQCQGTAISGALQCVNLGYAGNANAGDTVGASAKVSPAGPQPTGDSVEVTARYTDTATHTLVTIPLSTGTTTKVICELVAMAEGTGSAYSALFSFTYQRLAGVPLAVGDAPAPLNEATNASIYASAFDDDGATSLRLRVSQSSTASATATNWRALYTTISAP